MAFQVGLPVPNPTRSFWIDTPVATSLASEGNLCTDADICIIGSGITGVSVGYHLANSFALESEGAANNGGPVRAVILEARDFCSGATGRNGGHLTPKSFLNFRKRELAYGTEQAVRSTHLESYTSAELVKIIRSENLDVDLVAGGHIALLVTEKEVETAQADYAAAKAAGINLEGVEWLPKEAVESTYGPSYPAYRLPAHNLWPLKFVTELYKLAQKKTNKFSLDLHTHTPVTAVSPISDYDFDGRRWLLATPRGDVRCTYVIHATNGYAGHLLQHLRGPAGIIPTRGQVIALQAKASLEELTKASWASNERFEYWFPRPVKKLQDGKEEHPVVIFGGGRQAGSPNAEQYETDDSVLHPDVGNYLREYLPKWFPEKYERGREPIMEWTGIMGFTKLGEPFVGPVVDQSGSGLQEFKGQFIAAGYTGHGMPRAYACAEVVAGMVAAEIRGKSWTSPEWLPRRFLTFIRDAPEALTN